MKRLHLATVGLYQFESLAANIFLRITSKYIYPLASDAIRFDFEVDSQDEHLCVIPR